LNDFQKASDPKWDKLLQSFDCFCRRTKVLVTTRKEPEALRGTKIPTGAHKIFDVPELPKEVAQDYLRAEGLSVDEATSVRIWEKCEGNPMAMKLFAQAARRRSIERVLALPLPAWHEDAAEWMDELLADLSEPAKEVAKRLSLFDEPVEEDLLLAIGATEKGLWELQDFRLVDRTVDDRWREHDLLREYWQTKLSDQERRDWHRKAGEWLRQQAENLQAAQSERDPEAWSLEVQTTWASYLRRAFWHFANAGEAPLALQTASPITRFLRRWGEWDELLRLCEKSLQLAKESGDEKAVAEWTHRLAMCLHDRGDYEEAERLYRESLEISERLGNLAGKAATLHELGRLAQNRGDYEEVERLYRESLEISERLGNLAGKAVTLHALGRLRWKQGRKAEAEELLRQALDIFERIGHRRAKGVRKDLERLQSESA
jgi:tetratricopeptide (TPR) repeat protein